MLLVTISTAKMNIGQFQEAIYLYGGEDLINK